MGILNYTRKKASVTISTFDLTVDTTEDSCGWIVTHSILKLCQHVCFLSPNVCPPQVAFTASLLSIA